MNSRLLGHTKLQQSNCCGRFLGNYTMRFWTSCLLLSVLLLCSFQCESEIDRFYVKNRTDYTIVISSQETITGRAKLANTTLSPGESVEIYSHQGAPSRIYVMDLDVLLYLQDGPLLRYWTRYDVSYDLDAALEYCYARYFQGYGVRQFYDEGEWDSSESEKITEHTFNILPEDLVPLSEYVMNYD